VKSQVTALRDVIRPGTTRILDFVVLEELRKRTGITPKEVLKFALSEMLCNALDKDDATEIHVDLQVEGAFYRLAVIDNGGKKLTAREVKLIFDFERKASSKRGLKPVLLLFYDHDIAGLKITKTFMKGLRDISRGTGWDPSGLRIERFGLNKEGIDRYSLTWIENLKSSSGRDPDWRRRDVEEYVWRFGVRKCESNAFFRDDEALKAGEDICRRAIEKYYGGDALERFRGKEEASKENLKEVYEDSVWENFYNRIEDLIRSLIEKRERKEKHTPVSEGEVEVKLDSRYYGRCLRCGNSFNYDRRDVGRLVRCRFCNLPMRLKWVGG